MSKYNFCDFGKEIRKKLVEIDQNQNWLIEQVKNDTGLYFDGSYLHKIMVGKTNTNSIVKSIKKILNLK